MAIEPEARNAASSRSSNAWMTPALASFSPNSQIVFSLAFHPIWTPFCTVQPAPVWLDVAAPAVTFAPFISQM